MKTKDTDDVTALVIVGMMFPVILFVLLAPLIVVQGYVISTLWGWFVCPLFCSVSLTPVQAMGLATTYYAFQSTPITHKCDEDKAGRHFAKSLFREALVLAVGYVIHLFL